MLENKLNRTQKIEWSKKEKLFTLSDNKWIIYKPKL